MEDIISSMSRLSNNESFVYDPKNNEEYMKEYIKSRDVGNMRRVAEDILRCNLDPICYPERIHELVKDIESFCMIIVDPYTMNEYVVILFEYVFRCMVDIADMDERE